MKELIRQRLSLIMARFGQAGEQERRKLLVLTVLIGAAFLYLDVTLILGMQLKHVKALQPKVVRLKKDLESFSSGFSRMQDAKTKELKGGVEAQASQRIYSAQEVTRILQHISDIANANAIKIVQIKPMRDAAGLKPEKASSADKYSLFLINLDLVADYHNFGKFMNDIENAKTFLGVQSVKMSAQAQDAMHQKIVLVLKTYVKK